MNLYCIKCLMFTKVNNIKLKRKVNGKINLYSSYINCSFKSLELSIKKKLVIY